MAQPPIFFSETAQALLSGHVVRATLGVRLDLLSETLFLCEGDSFTDNAGQAWTGLGLLGSISGVSVGAEIATAPLQMTLSGVVGNEMLRSEVYPAFARAISASNSEIVGRRAVVYLHLFDATAMTPIDFPYMLQIYQMGNAVFAFDGAAGSATLTVPADPLFGGKHIPPLNLVSDADQQAKYPGDRIFERMGWRKTVITY